MSKTKTISAAIPRLSDIPAVGDLVAQQAEISEELERIRVELADRQRPLDQSWREQVAAAIEAGRPVPARPAIAGATELVRRAEDLELAAGMVRERLRALVDEESRRIWGATSERRAVLVRKMHAGLADLIAATREYEDLRAEYEAAGVKLGYLLSPIPLAELEGALHEYSRRAPDQAVV